MERFVGLFERLIAEGTQDGEFAPGNARCRAVRMVASLEGAIVLSNLYKDPSYMEAVTDELTASLLNGLR
jgi:hypothetical protein